MSSNTGTTSGETVMLEAKIVTQFGTDDTTSFLLFIIDKPMPVQVLDDLSRRMMGAVTLDLSPIQSSPTSTHLPS